MYSILLFHTCKFESVGYSWSLYYTNFICKVYHTNRYFIAYILYLDIQLDFGVEHNGLKLSILELICKYSNDESSIYILKIK